MIRRALIGVLLLLWTWAPAMAHDIRAGLLQITEMPNGHYGILWRVPVYDTALGRLKPRIGNLLDQPPIVLGPAGASDMSIWPDIDPGPEGIEGKTLSVDGLEGTISDVVVTITLANGETIQSILNPRSPSMVLSLHKNGLAVPAYLTLGIEHILTGVDHLSFVLGLMLLVRNWITLLKTVTAFTVAHSITLALTALHIIAVRPSVIEALVALSILFVAVELVHSYRGRNGLTIRYPWLIAFTFGLLHGSAFAGALAEIGLPPHDIPLSLLLFNVGVELGQLMFIGTVLLITWGLSKLPRQLPAWTRWIPPYAIGAFSAYWFIDRLHTALTATLA